MLTAAALLSLLGAATLVAAAVARLADGIERRRRRQVAAQVRVTDAVHGALGAIVAPTVARRRRQPWTVRMGLGPRERRVAGELADIAQRILGEDGGPVRIVFTPRAG
jgi:hypothetical protein